MRITLSPDFMPDRFTAQLRLGLTAGLIAQSGSCRVGDRTPFDLSVGGFPVSALRTGRARLHASGSLRVHAAGEATVPVAVAAHGVAML